MIKKQSSNVSRLRRHKRVRKTVSGTASRPRLCVYRSLKNIYAQIIDDDKGVTLAAASSLEGDLKATYSGNKDAIEKGIDSVVFDRGGYIYHGRVLELAEGAREAGLKF